jgi:inversin
MRFELILLFRFLAKRTPLHWAASYGHLDQVKMLIKQDSNIGIPDVEGRTPLHWAASSKDSQAGDCVKLILVSYSVHGKF